MSAVTPETDREFMSAYGLRPACRGMSRKDVTSLLNRELVRLRLTRRNAYSYWAHEVELEEGRRVDFVQFEPADYHAATRAGNAERGRSRSTR